MNKSDNMKIVEQYFYEVLREQKHELLDHIIHPGYKPFPYNVDPPSSMDEDSMKEELIIIPGVEGLKSRINFFFEQFGEANFDFKQVIETKETIVVDYNISMKHIGKWNEIPATGINISTHGIYIINFDEGKISSISGMLNVYDIFSQLGIISQLKTGTQNEKERAQNYLTYIRKIFSM